METSEISNNELVQRHSADVSTINISAWGGSHITAPVIINSTITGNVHISSNTNSTGPAVEIIDINCVISEYKKSLLCEYAYITEYTSRAGEQVLLNQRYVDPLIVQKHRESEEREREIRSRGQKFFTTRHGNQTNQNINLNELFAPSSCFKTAPPSAVILQGDSGSGKSIMMQKIVVEWASGKLFADLFDVIFHLRCKELNGLSSEMSLVELLDCSLSPNEISQIIKDKPRRILFIVDGFDELRSSETTGSLPQKPDLKAYPSAIVCSLLKGRLMRDSYLLVTTRSAAVEHLESVLKKPQCFMEILGFSEKGVCDYFLKFYEDAEFSSQVYEQVKVHEMLYTACFVPVICWIVCTIFKRKGKEGVVTSELTTTTSIFVDFVQTLLKHHSTLTEDQKLDLLKNLSGLAESGTPKRQVLFLKDSLPKSISDQPNIPFLCTFRQQERTYLKEMFGFMHLSFQEFFAALFYMFLDKEDAKKKVKELLELAGNGRFNDHLLPVIRFLFGLSNKKVCRLILGEHQRSTCSSVSIQLKKWISRVLEKNIMSPFYMSEFILHCLYELHDEDVLKSVMKIWESSGISINWTLKGIDCQVVMFCLKFSKRIESMSISCKARNLKVLSPTFQKCNSLWLDIDFVSDADVDSLILSLKSRKNVNYLKMKDGSMSDESVQKILKSLSEQTSVGDVRLALSTVNCDNACEAVQFLEESMKEKSFSVCIASQVENRMESLCSEFTMESNCKSFRLTVGHTKQEAYSSGKDGLPSYNGFSKISFALPDNFSVACVKDFLRISHNLRSFSVMKCASFGENVENLLSFLPRASGLSEVEICAERLTDVWTSKILSYFHVSPQISKFKFFADYLMIVDKKKICSTFSVMRSPYVPYKMHESEEKNPSLVLAMDRWGHEMVDSNSQTENSDLLLTPALVKLILSFPPMKELSFDWETFFRLIYQLFELTEQCPRLDEHMDSLLQSLHSISGLKEVKVWLSSLISSWAAGLFSFFLSCSSLLHLQIKTSMSLVKDVESIGMKREDGVRLSVGCNHLTYLDDYIDLFAPPVHNVCPCITITMTDELHNRNTDWTKFFQIYNVLKDQTECCQEYDENVSQLLSVLHLVSGLKKLELIFRFMTVDGAARVLELIQTNASLSSLSFTAAKICEEEEDNNKNGIRRNRKSEECSDSDTDVDDCDEDSTSSSDSSREEMDLEENVERILCSDLTMWKFSSGKRSLRLKCKGSSGSEQSFLSEIQLTLCESAAEAYSNWKAFMRAYNQCNGLSTSRSAVFAEAADALLVSLHSLAGLRQVQIKTTCLTEDWAPKIFSLCHSCPSLDDVSLQAENVQLRSYRHNRSLSVCSKLGVTRNSANSTFTLNIQSAHDFTVSTNPSFISFTTPCSELPMIKGDELLQTLDKLRGLEESCLKHGELVSELMSFLHSVSGLQDVSFGISRITGSWLRKILHTANVCPSLQVIRLHCKEIGGLSITEIEEFLQRTQTDSDCRIIISWTITCKATESSSEGLRSTARSASSEEMVTVTFRKCSQTRLFTLHDIHRKDDDGDDDEDDDNIGFFINLI